MPVRTTVSPTLELVPRLRGRLAAVGALAAISAAAEVGALLVAVSLALGLADSNLSYQLPGAVSDLSTGTMAAVGASLAAGVFILHTLVAALSARTASQALVRARTAVLQAFSRASWPLIADRREGWLQDTVGQLAVDTANATLARATQVSAGSSLATLVAAGLLINPTAALIVSGLGLLFFLALRPLNTLTQRRARDFVHHNSQLVQEAGSLSRLAMDLHAFGVAPAATANYDKAIHDVSARYERSRFLVRLGTSIYRDLALVLIVLGLGSLALFGAGNLAEVGTVALIALRSLGYAQAVQTSRQQVIQGSAGVSLLEARVEEMDGSMEPDGQVGLTRIQEITLNGVGYEYPNGVALRSVSLRIRANEGLGIVGPSGGGKSTLAQILLRLRVPTTGRLLLNGVPYEQISDADWRRLVAFVPQDPQLVAGTVDDNVRFFRDSVTETDIDHAIAAAHLEETVAEWPEGRNTYLGARGIGLSGGQKQRLAIARALAGHPQVLILDEPTSALDPHSEESVVETLEGLAHRVTLIIVAHRPGALKAVDRIVRLDKTGLVETDTWNATLDPESR